MFRLKRITGSAISCLTAAILALSSGIALPLSAAAETVLSPYGCYTKLDFEGVNPDSLTWDGEIDFRFVKNDPILTAHSGVGAMYVNADEGGGQFSVWGGPDSSEQMPQAGDKVGGYFYYKRLSDDGDWKLPRVRIYSEAEGNNSDSWYAVTKDIDTTDKNSFPLGEWVRIELESTGKIVSAEDAAHMGYNITCDAPGGEFMIDDVVFGALTGSEEPDPNPPASSVSGGVVPAIEEYAGSTINGDFEVGNDSVGNQYWGSWPNANMLRLITNPSSTEAGSAKSGLNMIEITDNGTSWNLFDFAVNEDDCLPRLGDVVGGSYWLYVPEDADLTQGVPYVNFGYQGSNGSDVMISTGSGFDKTKLVKGAWNEIPILPMDGGSIEYDGKMTAIFILAQNMPLDSGYYIDNIKVGKITEGVLFAAATSLVDEEGNPVELAEADTQANAKIVVQNSLYDTDTQADAVLAAYEDGRLYSIVTDSMTIPARGSAGMSMSEMTLSGLNIDGADKDKLRVKVFLFDSLENMTPLSVPYNLYYKTKRIAPDDENIRYIGRWAGNSDSYESTYIRPYLKTAFTGSSVQIDLNETSSLVVTVDGETTTYNSVSGLVTLAENLSAGVHSLRVATLHYTEQINYNGLYIENDAELVYPELESKHIEFIGDSITAWDNGYSWQVGELLGVEHSRIAWPGIALVDGYGYTDFNPLLGIASGYFKLGLPGTQGIDASVPDWDFDTAQYTPDIIVINIGTNDCESIWAVPSLLENFTNVYSEFIDKLRAQFPAAEIFVMRAVSMPRENVNQAVVDMLTPKLAEDPKLHYIDTSDWGVTLLDDNIHPDTNGHTVITNELAQILAPYADSEYVPEEPEDPVTPPEGDESLSVYGCWDNLKFESDGQTPGNTSVWEYVTGDVSFTNSSELAHTGDGALMLSGAGPTSVYGVRVAGDPVPAEGDIVSGYFWLKLLQPATSLPNVKMIKYNDDDVIFCQTKAMTAEEIAALPIGEWVRIDLESTGVGYYEGVSVQGEETTSGFAIETPGGVNCLIDDVTFGKIGSGQTQPGGEEIVDGLKKITPDNENIRYIGRWSGDSESFESGWVRPYIKIKFTGSTLKMDLQEPTNLQVVIDGQRVYGNFGSEFSTVDGRVTIAENLSDGEHEARISTIDLYKRIKYGGFWVDEDSVLSQPTTYKTHIEFIGDSLTAANDGYAWTAGEALNTEHSRIAWPGIALTDTRGYTGFYPYYGMESAYSFVTLPGSQNTSVGTGVLWDFDRSHYEPDIFVINLGTNDAAQITGDTAAVEGFENSYKNLMQELRQRYPDAEIFALEAVSIPNADVNQAIEDAILESAASDDKIHYIETSSWGVEISGDGIHPTMAGYNTMSERLVEILSDYVVPGTEVVTPPSLPGTLEAPPYTPEELALEEYGGWEHLDFESAPNMPANSGIWDEQGNISFVSGIAYSGNASMKITGSYATSLWGNAVDGNPVPQAGDKVGGYFWVYLLEQPTALPVVKIRDSGSLTTIYASTDTGVDLSTLPLNTWIKINILPTDTAFIQGSVPLYAIETGVGFNGYVDDIHFGKMIED